MAARAFAGVRAIVRTDYVHSIKCERALFFLDELLNDVSLKKCSKKCS